MKNRRRHEPEGAFPFTSSGSPSPEEMVRRMEEILGEMKDEVRKLREIQAAIFGENPEPGRDVSGFYDAIEYQAAIRALARKDRRPLERYLQKGGRIPT
jgi:hypothetical protein